MCMTAFTRLEISQGLEQLQQMSLPEAGLTDLGWRLPGHGVYVVR